MCAPEGLPDKHACGIGLLGGTFDPVHVGHIALAEQALKVLNLTRVDFLPAGNPWQKHPLTPAVDRVRMLELAVAGKPGLAVNLCEVNRPGPTYTVDTLRQRGGKSDRQLPWFSVSGPINGKTFKRGKPGTRFLTTPTSP